jgi:superfamily II DNA or RNA helicase
MALVAEVEQAAFRRGLLVLTCGAGRSITDV